MNTLQDIQKKLASIQSEVDLEKGSLSSKLEKAQDEADVRKEALQQQLLNSIKTARQKCPVLTGDGETVLLHHFGIEALDDQVGLIIKSIQENILAAVDGKKDIPILFCYPEEFHPYDGPSSEWNNTALVLVPAAHASKPFTSSCAVTQESMHAFTSEKAPVTRLKLAITGKALTVRSGFSEGNNFQVPKELESELVIRSSNTAAGRYGSGMSTYSFGNSYFDAMLPYTSESQKNSKRDCLVGWNEINTFLTRQRSESAYKNLHKLCKALQVSSYGKKGSRLDSAFRLLDTIKKQKDSLRRKIDSKSERV